MKGLDYRGEIRYYEEFRKSEGSRKSLYVLRSNSVFKGKCRLKSRNLERMVLGRGSSKPKWIQKRSRRTRIPLGTVTESSSIHRIPNSASSRTQSRGVK